METQSGQGATPERLKKSKFHTVETIQAGVFSERVVWKDVVAFMIDEKIAMLPPTFDYGWQAFLSLHTDRHGTGNGGEGWNQQQLLIFQKIIGNKYRRLLETLFEYPVPYDDKSEVETRWRLNQCLRLIKESLNMASKAAVEARKEIDSRKNP